MTRFEPGIFTFKLKGFIWLVLKLRFSVPSQKMMLSVRFEPWIFSFKLKEFTWSVWKLRFSVPSKKNDGIGQIRTFDL